MSRLLPTYKRNKDMLGTAQLVTPRCEFARQIDPNTGQLWLLLKSWLVPTIAGTSFELLEWKFERLAPWSKKCISFWKLVQAAHLKVLQLLLLLLL